MSEIDLSEFEDVIIKCGSSSITNQPITPFSNDACSFLSRVSEDLLHDKRFRSYSDVVSFAYWCRRANIQREKDKRLDLLRGRIGRGVAFHISPGNVPVNFAFSYAFSILAGNPTIVRLPSRHFDQADIILEAMSRAMNDYPAIYCRTAFISYPASSGITDTLSRYSDARVLWGSDQTILKIKKISAKPRCVDVVFPDRFSIAVLNLKAVGALDDKQLVRLARDFYNDTFAMDQNACSSPRIVLWDCPDDDKRLLRARFWAEVDRVASKLYDLQDAIAVDKYVDICLKIISNDVANMSFGGRFATVATLVPGTGLNSRFHGVGGLFYEELVDNPVELIASADEKLQTVTYYGIDPVSLRDELIKSNARSVDRIIPVGKALDIGGIWDGHDMYLELSRYMDAF